MRKITKSMAQFLWWQIAKTEIVSLGKEMNLKRYYKNILDMPYEKKNADIFLYGFSKFSPNTGINKSSMKLKVNQHNLGGRRKYANLVSELIAPEL